MTDISCRPSSVSPIGESDLARAETSAVDHPDADDTDLRYGCGKARPPWLQWLNNIVGVVTLFCAANFMLNFTNGLVGVVLSTIERRFDLTSSQSSWIAAGYEIGGIPIVMVTSICGNSASQTTMYRIHRPVALSLGLLSMSVGCIMFFLPQFIAPPYRPNQQDSDWSDGLCDGNKSSTCDVTKDSESMSYFLPLFIVARFLTGMGGIPIYTVGLNHMDDCSTKEKFARYCGIFMAMAVIGPAFAFLLGALTLEIYTDFYLIIGDKLGFDSSDSRWIGCWWLPYIIAAVLCLLNAIPLWGYRRDLPGAADIRAKKVTEAHRDDQCVDNSPTSSEMSYAKMCGGLGRLAKSVFTNPTYMALTLFAICDNFIMAGFTAFGPKYFEFAFSMSPTLAGLIFGVVLIPAGAGGTIIGGVVIEKLRLSCKQIMKIQMSLAGMVTVACFLLLLVCDSAKFAGINVPYNSSVTFNSSPFDLSNTCNANCSCDGVSYEPVCSHDKVQYFSPCHAGCSFRNKTSSSGYNFHNCSCIKSLPQDTSLPFAVSGNCSLDICPEAIVFLVLFFVAVFGIFACTTTNTSSTLRCVTSSQTAFALGVQVLIVKLVGTIPGPLMMGVAFDNTCLLWQTLPCSDVSGSCAFYDNAALSKNFTILMVTVKFLSFAAMLFAVTLYRPPQMKSITPTTPIGNDKKKEGCGVGSQLTATVNVDDSEVGLPGFDGKSVIDGVAAAGTSIENGLLNNGFISDDKDEIALKTSRL